MPGMPQGRDINEAGPKTVSLVTLRDDRSLAVEERPISLAQFERVAVDLGGIASWREAIGRIEQALAAQRERTVSEHLVARLSLGGTTPLAWRLRRDRDLLLAEAEQRAERLGRTWIDKIELVTTATTAAAPGSAADPLVELRGVMRSDIVGRHAIREAVRELAETVRDDLPPEARGFGGDDEAGFEAFLTRLLEEGSDEVMARLAPGGEDA